MSLGSKIAVDVVLLPEQEMTDCAIAANTELVGKFQSRIVLNISNCLPHISLMMGCMNRDDVARVGESLRPLMSEIPETLHPAGVQKSANFSGETVFVLQVERSDQLQKLHENICEAVKPYFTYDATEDMIAGGRSSLSTLQWIKNYPVSSSHSNFSPHITIGYGDLPNRSWPDGFAVSCLALCQLGDNCTCAEILWLQLI